MHVMMLAFLAIVIGESDSYMLFIIEAVVIVIVIVVAVVFIPVSIAKPDNNEHLIANY